MKELVGDLVRPKRSWRIALKRFAFGWTSLEAQLYPPLERKVVFRLYEERDFEACLAIYRKNEPGRFPPRHGSKFAEYLKKEQKTLIVAQSDSRVVGYGGINLMAPNTAALCYGIVDPEFQRQRIGSALTLLRIAQLPSEPRGAFVFVFAVNASMPIYRRFGFIEATRWKTEDDEDHPLGFLHVPLWSLDRVKSVLKRRQLRVQGDVVLHPSNDTVCEIQLTPAGSFRFQFRRPGDEASTSAQGRSPDQ
jgi:ribosomal protein S18 acetylase RimI-like enzyme